MNGANSLYFSVSFATYVLYMRISLAMSSHSFTIYRSPRGLSLWSNVLEMWCEIQLGRAVALCPENLFGHPLFKR